MKKFYALAFLCFMSLVQIRCSKDFLKTYDKRIQGSWEIIDVDRVGIGGSISSLNFKEGTFTFTDDGKLEYINNAGEIYSGSWNLRKERYTGNCASDDDGNRVCNDRTVQTLQLTAINFTTKDVKSEFFNDLQFTNTNHFKAFIYSGSKTYVFRFLRL